MSPARTEVVECYFGQPVGCKRERESNSSTGLDLEAVFCIGII
uniref:Uncharacterized protein n=1 Tax=Octopus bimaculoides TaxID=37653 RepID=A0A0L8FV95_OCTBM